MSRRLRTLIGVLLSLLLLGWALRDVSPTEVLHQVRGADPLLLAASILVSLAGFHIRALRWGVALLPINRRVPFTPRLAATYIGFAANNLLPARVGEFARAFALSRLADVRPAAALATLVVERMLDGIVLLGLLFVSMTAPGFPSGVQVAGVDLQSAAMTVAGVMLVLAGVLFFAVARPRTAGRFVHVGKRLLPPRLRQPFVDAMRSFSAGLLVLKSGRLLLASLLLAIGQWVFLAVSFLLAFRAFRIDEVPFSGAVFLQSLVALAVAVPSSPGFFGPFEAASRVGLGLWNIPVDQAISFAIGFHIAGFLPVSLIGVYYVWKLNLSWSEVRKSEKAVEEEGSAGTPIETTRAQ